MNKKQKVFLIGLELPSQDKQEEFRSLFPELFSQSIKVGQWYRSTSSKAIVKITARLSNGWFKTYGFDCDGDWMDSDSRGFISPIDFILATSKDVYTALRNEAVKRGFVKGAFFQSASSEATFTMKGDFFNTSSFPNENLTAHPLGCVFIRGKWAELCIRKSCAEKQLGKKII